MAGNPATETGPGDRAETREPPSRERRLHIGGQVRAEGWEVLDANPGPCVDHVGNANDLSRFPEGTFAALYASHVLEHFDYHEELVRTLREWWRVLAPGGRLYASVPDLDTLARLFLDRESFARSDRFLLMRMMFGGHVDPWDYHKVGLNEEFLGEFLRRAGFCNVRRVDDLGFFDDTSRMRFGGSAISLNMIAEKPDLLPAGQPGARDGPGRNDPCPCGSGRRYKHCHGKLA